MEDNPNNHNVVIPAEENQNEAQLIRYYFDRFDGGGNFHQIPVTAICFFQAENDETIIATGDNRGNVKLWNIMTGQLVHDLTNHHLGEIKAIVTYKHEKGIYLITGGFDRIAKIWNYSMGIDVQSFVRNDRVFCLAVCETTGLLAVASSDRVILIHEMNRDRPSTEFQSTHTDLILSLAIISPDNNSDNSKIVSVGWDKNFFVWGRNGEIFTPFETYHTKSITTLTAHIPRGEETREGEVTSPVLITGSLDKTAAIWDFETRELVKVLEGHEAQISAVKVSDRNDDGSPPIVITASHDKTIRLWDLISGYNIRVIKHTEALNTLAILDSPEGIVVVSSGGSLCLAVWDLRRTRRTRAYPTFPVTTIDVVESDVLIGSVDGKFTLFAMDTEQQISQETMHTRRINAQDKYIPNNHNNPPLVVSADGAGQIKVWEMQNRQLEMDRVQRTFHADKFVVLTVAVYDPKDLHYKQLTEPDTRRIDLAIPCLLSGGAEKNIKVWDFLGLTGRDLLGVFPDAHAANVRSLIVYHPSTAQTKPLFISGSYDMTTKLWDLETLTPIRVFSEVHTDFVFFTAIYDPARQFDPDPNLPRIKTFPTIISSSYDRSFAVWDMFPDGDDFVQTVPRMHKTEAHNDSITALAVYCPPRGSNDAPILITGSIDRLIHLWNLFTGEKIQTLVGHTDRVCFIKVYNPPGRHPVILSGGDDRQTILWGDTLYQKAFMPLRESVIRSFESDCKTTNWPMISEIAGEYGAAPFIENSNLFMMAVIRKRPDFLLKFWVYLTITLPTIKYERLENIQPAIQAYTELNRTAPETEFDILSAAIIRCDLVSVRAILLSWIKNLNQDMENMLTQRSYHASYFFPDRALELLHRYYPSEFLKFFTSLRLVKNNVILAEGNPMKKLDPNGRYECQGSNSRVDKYEEIWANYENFRSYFVSDQALAQLNPLEKVLSRFDRIFLRLANRWEAFFGAEVEPQPVTSLMVPIRNCNEVEKYLKMCVSVSNQLNDVSIFESPVGDVFLRYFWHKRGRSTHVIAFLKYLLFFSGFLICVYSPQIFNQKYLLIRLLMKLLILACVAAFGWYLYEELDQLVQTSALGHWTQIHHRHVVAHITDLWNFVDLVVVVFGMRGLMLRFSHDEDIPQGRTMLAIASVFMWFKILYFLRPFASTGPLVAMILQIAKEIRTFLFVLFCVLAGFAQAFWLLSYGYDNPHFNSVKQAFLNAFLYMLGQNIDVNFSGTADPMVATIFLVVFLIAMMILMLNLLIAQMGDVFSQVRSEGVGLWRKEQAAIISEEAFLNQVQTEIPAHLLVLKYSSEVGRIEIDFAEEVKYLIEVSDVKKFTPLKKKEGEEEEGRSSSSALKYVFRPEK